MNEKKILRFWKYAVVLLVLCNTGLIAVIWLKPRSPFGPRPETPRDFIIRDLKFSGDQVKKYDALIDIHKASMDRLRKESMEYRELLFANLKNNGQNNINTDSLCQLIADNQKQIELVTYNHFAQVRALCTDAQKTEFDKIINDVTKMMSGPPAHHRPPPGHNQGPPPPPGGPQNGPQEND